MSTKFRGCRENLDRRTPLQQRHGQEAILNPRVTLREKAGQAIAVSGFF
jgi:hypothetical protein